MSAHKGMGWTRTLVDTYGQNAATVSQMTIMLCECCTLRGLYSVDSVEHGAGIPDDWFTAECFEVGESDAAL